MKMETSTISNDAHNKVTPKASKEFESSSEDEEPVAKSSSKIEVHFGAKMPDDQRNKTNKVRTTKYTILTWAPYSLLF
jgi:hypothetical protein